jgi:hypothetical protein
MLNLTLDEQASFADSLCRNPLYQARYLDQLLPPHEEWDMTIFSNIIFLIRYSQITQAQRLKLLKALDDFERWRELRLDNTVV